MLETFGEYAYPENGSEQSDYFSSISIFGPKSGLDLW